MIHPAGAVRAGTVTGGAAEPPQEAAPLDRYLQLAGGVLLTLAPIFLMAIARSRPTFAPFATATRRDLFLDAVANARRNGTNVVDELLALGARAVPAKLGGRDIPMFDMRGLDFSGKDFRQLKYGTPSAGIDFSGCKFTDSRLDLAIFDHCSFNRTWFKNTGLKAAYFRCSEFVATRMQGASLPETRFFRSSFVGADLSDSRWLNAEIRSCRFSGRVRLEGARFDGGFIHGDDLEGWTRFSNLDATHLFLNRTGLHNVAIAESDFRGMTATGTVWNSLRIHSTDFSHSRFDGGGFQSECNFEKCVLQSVQWRDPEWGTFATPGACRFKKCDLTDSGLMPSDHRNGQIYGTTFDDCRMTRISLHPLLQIGSPASPIRFISCGLHEARLSGAVLDVRARHVVFERYNWLRDAHLSGTTLSTNDGSWLPRPVVRGDFDSADLRGAKLAGLDFIGSSFNRADLRGADCRGAYFGFVVEIETVLFDRATNLEGAFLPAWLPLTHPLRRHAAAQGAQFV